MNDLLIRAEQLETLEDALRWARAAEPRIIPLETVPQDEYTHDVVFQVNETAFVVFDAT